MCMSRHIMTSCSVAMVFVCLTLRILVETQQQIHNLSQGHGDPQGRFVEND